MNFKQHLLTTAAATTALVGVISGPAQAFNLGKSFTLNAETIFDFNFVESHGYFKSIVGLQGPGGTKIDLIKEVTRSDGNSNAKDWKGTAAGGTVTTSSKSVTLGAGTYSFFLDRANDAGVRTTIGNYGAHFYNEADTATVLSDRVKWDNPNKSPNSLLATKSSSASTNPFTDTILIGFEDFGLPGQTPHVDYNDMILTVKATQVDVPEPATLAGLGLVAGVAAFSGIRRRRVNQPS